MLSRSGKSCRGAIRCRFLPTHRHSVGGAPDGRWRGRCGVAGGVVVRVAVRWGGVKLADAVLLQTPVELRAAQAEKASRLGLVPLRLHERSLHETALGVVEVHAVAGWR